MIRALFALLLLPGVTVARAAPLDTVLAALAAEAAAPIERMRLFIDRDGVADIWYLDRVGAGRLRLLKNPKQGGPEIIVVDGVLWQRDGSGWRRSPAPAIPDLIPSTAGMFRAALTDATEQPGPDGGVMVEGVMTWSSATTCRGRVSLRIGASGLPTQLRFNGQCGGKPTRFRQDFSFEGPLEIAAPQ